MAATPEGSIVFRAKHEHADWLTNGSGYNFPPITGNGVTVEAVKHPDHTYVVTVSGLAQGQVKFTHPVPTADSRGVHTVVTWSPKRVTLHLNGKEVDHVDIQTH